MGVEVQAIRSLKSGLALLAGLLFWTLPLSEKSGFKKSRTSIDYFAIGRTCRAAPVPCNDGIRITSVST